MSSRVQHRGSGLAIVGFLLVSAIVAGIGGSVTVPSIPGWYHGLNRPSWTPPDWLFGPAWTVLYILMAISGWLIWRVRSQGALRHDRRLALRLYALQLLLNALWSPLFFGLHLITWGLADIAALLVVLVLTITTFARVNPTAALLFAPYVAWVTFASTLNLSIFLRN